MNRASTVAFVGAGSAGSVLSKALAHAGRSVVAIASRTSTSAVAVAADLPLACVLPVEEIASSADVVFLTVPDGSIDLVARNIKWRPGQVAIHCSGAVGVEALASATGCRLGTWHPLQSLARPGVLLSGSAFAIEGPDDVSDWLAELTNDLGGRPIFLPPGFREAYHLGATLVSNYAVALVALAAELWRTFGISRSDAVAALAPLLAGTAANLTEVGLPKALTGPVVRGDLTTVDRHLGVLSGAKPTLAETYRLLGNVLVSLAEERGLDGDRLAELKSRFPSDPRSLSHVGHNMPLFESPARAGRN